MVVGLVVAVVVVVGVVVCVVVMLVVCVVDGVEVSVVVVVIDVVAVVVALDVTELVAVVVSVVVVAVVVGVVTSHSAKPPTANASVIAFNVSAVASQSLRSIITAPKAHSAFSEDPSGPRNACSAPFKASTAVSQFTEGSATTVAFPTKS